MNCGNPLLRSVMQSFGNVMGALDGLSQEWWKDVDVEADVDVTVNDNHQEIGEEDDNGSIILEIQEDDNGNQQQQQDNAADTTGKKQDEDDDDEPFIFQAMEDKCDCTAANADAGQYEDNTFKQEGIRIHVDVDVAPPSPIEFVDSQESHHHDNNYEDNDNQQHRQEKIEDPITAETETQLEDEEVCLEASESTVPYHSDNDNDDNDDATILCAASASPANGIEIMEDEKEEEEDHMNDTTTTTTMAAEGSSNDISIDPPVLSIPNLSEGIEQLDVSTIYVASTTATSASAANTTSTSNTTGNDAVMISSPPSSRIRGSQRIIPTSKPRVLTCLLRTEDRRHLKTCILASLLIEIMDEITLEQQPPLLLLPNTHDDSTNININTTYTININRFALRLTRSSSILTATHVVSGGAEFPNYDGSLIVRRSFSYLFAIAAGLPVFNVRWIQQAASSSDDVSTSALLLPCLSVNNGNDNGSTNEEECAKNRVYEVGGCVEASQLFAPRRAMQAAAAKLSLSSSSRIPDDNDHANDDDDAILNMGSGLLEGYTCFLCGTFDVLKGAASEHRQGSGSRRKRRGNPKSSCSNANENVYTRGRIVALLQMCSANVFDLNAMHDEMVSCSCSSSSSSGSISSIGEIRFPVSSSLFGNNNGNNDPAKVVILVKNGATKREFKTAKKYASLLFSDNLNEDVIPVVSALWLLNSIGEFEIQKLDAFMM